jgi:hypothetical protein
MQPYPWLNHLPDSLPPGLALSVMASLDTVLAPLLVTEMKRVVELRLKAAQVEQQAELAPPGPGLIEGVEARIWGMKELARHLAVSQSRTSMAP